ncbi:pyocin S6 family toxin immunity protein [Pseudomonas sp. RP23018S]|uniref:pyocin S6 family toxin immunity protein n=1 Tax=Pseudomonas sp. RP23018S TaxID=3096037 RepID=UPI002ACA6774|nr:pyocin S6 family toxin immunity protein [Pseudomonas sp. RP23018S]MDZ5602966.1 pyocin S6 family toxin immunity protein [Pseudomonas sp. RP23018S]
MKLENKPSRPSQGEKPHDKENTMFLYVTGFFPEPHPDETLQFELIVHRQDEQAVLEIMEWQSLNDGYDGEQELTPPQKLALEKRLGMTSDKELTLFISTISG